MRVFFGLKLSLLATPFGGFSLSANAIVPHQQTDSLSGVEHQKSYSCNLPLIFVLQKSRKLTVQFCCIQFENSISKENKSARDRALAARRFVGSVNSLGEAPLYRWQPTTTTMETIHNARWWGVVLIVSVATMVIVVTWEFGNFHLFFLFSVSGKSTTPGRAEQDNLK